VLSSIVLVVQAANCVETYTEACRRVLSSIVLVVLYQYRQQIVWKRIQRHVEECSAALFW
jgi:hypothetical protein